MLNTNLDSNNSKQMNELGKELLERRGHKWNNPYDFYSVSALIIQFNLGENGVWLAIEGTSGKSPLEIYCEPKPISYCSHNVDTPKQAQSLMALVDMWIEYSDILCEK